MLLQELKEIQSGRRERHQFALVIAAALLIIAALLAWRIAFYPALAIAAAALLAPVAIDKIFNTDTAIVLLPLQKIWMGIAVVLGFFISRFILALFFFGIFTAVRALNTILGKPLLDTTWKDPARTTCWIKRDPTPTAPENTERQY